LIYYPHEESFIFGKLVIGVMVRVFVFNATFNNISVISWMSVLLVEETGIIDLPQVTEKFTTLVVIGTDSIGSYKSSYLRSQPRRPLTIVKVLYGML
jgi:hypothetical protein